VTTTARVGIDIVAQDKTRAAFASANASLGRFNRSMTQLKGVMAGLAGGNLMVGFIRSMVAVNREVPSVKLALDRLNGAWILFARKVGDSGLNNALVNFANRMAGMVMGTNSLGESIGRFLAGAVNVMAGVFEGIGRAVAFTYDNLAAFGRLLAVIGLVAFGRSILFVAGNMLLFYRSVAITAKGMLAFTAINRMGTAGFVLLAGIIGYATDSLDDMKAMIDAVWVKVKEVFPGLGQVATEALKDLGFNVDSLTGEFASAFDGLRGLENVAAPAAEKLKKTGDGIKRVGAAAKDTSFYMMDLGKSSKEANDAMSGVGDTFGSEFSSAFSSVIDGTKSVKEAFRDMAKGIITSLANSAVSRIFGSIFGGGEGGGIFGSLFGGARAGGGPVQSGKSYLVGENGPEVVRMGGDGTVIPNDALGGGGRTVAVHLTLNAEGADRAAIAALRADLKKMSSTIGNTIKSTVQRETASNPGFGRR